MVDVMATFWPATRGAADLIAPIAVKTLRKLIRRTRSPRRRGLGLERIEEKFVPFRSAAEKARFMTILRYGIGPGAVFDGENKQRRPGAGIVVLDSTNLAFRCIIRKAALPLNA
jgi:hypothetical protein